MGIKDKLRKLERLFRQNMKIEFMIVRRREKDKEGEYRLSNGKKISQAELDRLVEEKRSQGIDLRVIEIVLCSVRDKDQEEPIKVEVE